MFDRRARRAEHGDLASPLELLEDAEGMLHLAQGLQHDLGVPAVAVGLGHARHGEEHLAVEREIGAVAGSRKGRQFVDLPRQVGAAGLEVPGKIVIGFVGHSHTPSTTTLDRRSSAYCHGLRDSCGRRLRSRCVRRAPVSRHPSRDARGSRLAALPSFPARHVSGIALDGGRSDRPSRAAAIARRGRRSRRGYGSAP